MSEVRNKETLGFQAEVQQLLDLMIHSLYGNREIFLRELVSNASDAADKLRFEALRDDSLFEDDPDLKIRIEYNRDQKTISVIDNGIGMTRDEVVAHLGTIARSGTREFFKSLTGDQAKDSQLIGQFGVGFYSSFIVAEKVEVLTRRAGAPRGEGVRWISSGQNDYTIETLDRPRRGTRVTLHLREGAEEFLDGARLRAIVRRYSDHISLPIVMMKEGQDEKGEETVNSATALWTRNKKDITDEEYDEFYKHVAHDFEAPLARVHSRVEGKIEYTSLLFIPAHAPFDIWDRDHARGVKLYVRRVFIMDDAEQLLPPYLRFVRGIVDSDDLPLNVSREILQQNRTIDSIRAGCEKRILDLLADVAANDADRYATFWEQFGRVLKEGIIDSPDRKDDLARLFRFSSTASEGDAQVVSLADYVGRIKPGQKHIYYITADNPAAARNSPHLEIFRNRGVEVLLLTDTVDEWLSLHLTEFEGMTLQSVTRGELDADALGKEEQQEATPAHDLSDLVQRMGKSLGDRVKAVRVTRRLTSSPACLVADAGDMGRHLERLLKASGQAVQGSRPVLEINPEHPIIRRLEQCGQGGDFDDWSAILFDQAVLSEGGQLQDPAGFVQRLNRLMLNTAGPGAPD